MNGEYGPSSKCPVISGERIGEFRRFGGGEVVSQESFRLEGRSNILVMNESKVAN